MMRSEPPHVTRCFVFGPLFSARNRGQRGVSGAHHADLQGMTTKNHQWVPPLAGYGTPPRRPRLSPEDRRNLMHRVARRCGWRCWWCGRAFRQSDPMRRATLDHLVPHSAMGPLRASNLVLACRRCNELRGDMPVEQWQREVARLGLLDR
jgi:hypothetical protein